MKCPNDKTDMDKGYVQDYIWISGTRPWGSFIPLWLKKADFFIAWKCPTCGKIELVAEEKK